MNITNVKYVSNDGVTNELYEITFDGKVGYTNIQPEGRVHQLIQEWVEAGNTIEPADPLPAEEP